MQSFLDGSTRIMAATVAFGMGIDKVLSCAGSCMPTHLVQSTPTTKRLDVRGGTETRHKYNCSITMPTWPSFDTWQ